MLGVHQKNCHSSFNCGYRTITPAERERPSRRREPLSPITISPSAASSMQFRTALLRQSLTDEAEVNSLPDTQSHRSLEDMIACPSHSTLVVNHRLFHLVLVVIVGEG